MKEQLLKQMIAVVDEIVKYNKADFYKYDLHSLSAHETPEFFWSVRETGTSLMVINLSGMLDELRKSETVRFSFMQYPDEAIGWLLHLPGEKVFHYKDETLKEIDNVKEAVCKAWQPVRDTAIDIITKEFGKKEKRFWGAKSNVSFGSIHTAKMIYNALHGEGADSLRKILDSFRNWKRLAVDEVIFITLDMNGKDFFFNQIRNNVSVLCGGILFYDGKWHRHT